MRIREISQFNAPWGNDVSQACQLQQTLKEQPMALTQMQIIQSLGEAMSWFERELGWGVPPTELRHLSGRIGELYAALITNGQMASAVNQRGYDVVSDLGERISVKTTAKMDSGGHLSFNPGTLDLVDRIIVLRINTEEMQIETLLNEPIATARELMSGPDSSGKLILSHSKLLPKRREEEDIPAINTVVHGGFTLTELENGSIQVLDHGKPTAPVQPILRTIAGELSISTLNSNGNPYNTRQLGTLVIAAIKNRVNRSKDE